MANAPILTGGIECRRCQYTGPCDDLHLSEDSHIIGDVNPNPLQPGHELHCPHCRRWHPVMQKYTAGTDYTQEMLMWDCRGGSYYAGQIGTISRHPTRTPNAA